MRVVTAFCLACVCTELLVQLVEAGWARRCIKVVAGLYILTVLLRAISALPARQCGRQCQYSPPGHNGSR